MAIVSLGASGVFKLSLEFLRRVLVGWEESVKVIGQERVHTFIGPYDDELEIRIRPVRRVS